MESVFARNPGFVEIIKIKDIIFNNSKITSAFIGKLSSVELTMFKYAPVSSCDVERVFSLYGKSNKPAEKFHPGKLKNALSG